MLKTLERLGLSEKEAKVYLAALELGAASVLKISQKAEVNRATTYLMLESLIKKGLVSYFKKGKKRFFSAEAPERLLTSLREKKLQLKEQEEELIRLLPELRSIYNLAALKPRVRYYEGIEGLKSIYQDTLKEKKEILAFIALDVISKNIREWLKTEYIKLRKKENLRAKVIAPDTKEAREYQAKDKECLRETLLIPKEKYPFTIEINIYGNKVAFISYRAKEMIGVILESKEIARTMRSIFELCWKTAQSFQK